MSLRRNSVARDSYLGFQPLIRARSEFRIAKGGRKQVGRAAGAVAKRDFLGHLYRNCTRLRQFQRLLRLLRHAKSITCVDAIWLRGSTPTPGTILKHSRAIS